MIGGGLERPWWFSRKLKTENPAHVSTLPLSDFKYIQFYSIL